MVFSRCSGVLVWFWEADPADPADPICQVHRLCSTCLKHRPGGGWSNRANGPALVPDIFYLMVGIHPENFMNIGFLFQTARASYTQLFGGFRTRVMFSFFQDNLYWPQGTPTISCVRDWGTTHLKALNIQYTQSGVRIRIHFVSKLNLNLGWSTDACLLAWRSFFD